MARDASVVSGRILVIEDDPAIAAGIVDLLAPYG